MSATSTKGLVVSTEQHASAVGVETIRNGGNVIDAAVATAFTMAVSYPSYGNIGARGKYEKIDFQEVT